MAKNLFIQKTVYNKEQHSKVVDKNFSFFTPPEVDAVPSVEDFFNLYEQLFYLIPTEGESNSHEELVRRSSEVVDFEKDSDDIQPLLDEIASLREQLLTAREEIINLEVSNNTL